jgi:amino acid transporter
MSLLGATFIGIGSMVGAGIFALFVVMVILSGFAIAMLSQMDVSQLAPSSYPSMTSILASVALTFFAYLGFGVISFSGGDIDNPKNNMLRAMYIAIGFTMLLYVALAIGVFGTLTVDEVIANVVTALVVAAYPIFGAAGITLISISALFSTTGAVNSQLYAAIGATFAMAKDGHLPPIEDLSTDLCHPGGDDQHWLSLHISLSRFPNAPHRYMKRR